jgi:lipopolysaccharide biosynthesis glycosyltransferase
VTIHKYEIKILSNMEHNLLYYNQDLSNVMFKNDICYFDNETDYNIALDFLNKLRSNHVIEE